MKNIVLFTIILFVNFKSITAQNQAGNSDNSFINNKVSIFDYQNKNSQSNTGLIKAIPPTTNEVPVVINEDENPLLTEKFDVLDLRGDPIIISSKNIKLYAGKSYKIDFNLEQKEEISAFQFTLEAIDRAVEIQGVIPGNNANFSEQNYALSTKDNLLTVTWDNSDQHALPAKLVLFTLIINVQFDVDLIDAFKLSSKVTTTIGYNSKGEKVPVNLNIDGDADNPVPLHFTIGPNPVQSQLSISMILPQDTHFNLNLIDNTGKVFPNVFTQFLEKGNQGFDLDLNRFPNGIYYLQIELDGVMQPLQKLMIYK